MRPVSGCSQAAVGAFCASRFAVERGFLDPKPTCRAQRLSGARSSSGSRPRCLPRHGSLRDRPGGGGDAERVSDGIPFALNHKLTLNRFRCTRKTTVRHCDATSLMLCGLDTEHCDMGKSDQSDPEPAASGLDLVSDVTAPATSAISRQCKMG